MQALASILSTPLSGTTTDRLAALTRLAEVCTATRAALEEYAGSDVGKSGARLFAEANIGLDGDGAADLFAAVITADLLGSVFDNQFKGSTESAPSGEAEQHLIFGGVALLAEFEGFRALLAELLGELAINTKPGAVLLVKLAACRRAAIDLLRASNSYVSVLSSRTTVLGGIERELARAVQRLGGVMSELKAAFPRGLTPEKITDFLGVN